MKYLSVLLFLFFSTNILASPNCADPYKIDSGGEGGRQKFVSAQICYKKAMERELDERLLDLKKSNKEQFQKEMKLQAAFNQMVDQFCDIDPGSGFGTGWKIASEKCYLEFFFFRYKQAELINKKLLQMQCYAKNNPKRKEKKGTAMNNFIIGVCNLPIDVWKDNNIPKSCSVELKACIEKLNKS